VLFSVIIVRLPNQIVPLFMTSACKKAAKKKAQKAWGLQVDESIPMVLVRHISDDVVGLLEQIAEGFDDAGVQVVVVDSTREDIWKKLAETNPLWIKLLSASELDECVADMELMEEVTVDTLKTMKEERIVPVASSGIEAFDPVGESGNGFVFEQGNAWSLFRELVRAAETYKFPYDWGNVIKGL
jgi:ketopantoate reductase